MAFCFNLQWMTTRIAVAYARVLFLLELLLFSASLLLHMSALLGAKKPFANYGLMLFPGAVIVGLPVMAFVKDSLRWVDQIKSCPKWMWKGALAFGVYGIFTLLLQVIFPEGSSIDDQTLAVSGFPLGFEGISICILYSVLWSGYLEERETVRRALHSISFVGVGIAAFLLYRAGYLGRLRH